MPRLFQNPIPDIETLSLMFLGRTDPQADDVAPQQGVPLLNRATSKNLRISGSSAIGDYLIGTECPFNLSRVLDVVIYDSMTPSVAKAVECGRFTIRRLECFTYDLDFIQGLKLEHFPVLAHLVLLVPEYSLVRIIDGPSNASGNCIVIITVVIMTTDIENWDEEDEIERLDATLSSCSSMPDRYRTPFNPSSRNSARKDCSKSSPVSNR
ncbi:hypothetical protein B0H17DRAFT_1099867 [Mycena rosella]|uniref:Uncharacterized protein n=1 Tax=Mycena rosella TaxID=1033263 RepID=A0AAD7CN70_MYCRO|nr:hypothetical protein B0H17DRAFT_1099867 [Mycena rosella]